jgi:hypothetical protein
MKKVITLLITFSFNIILSAAVSKTVNVTAGGLATALTQTEKETITNLTLSGALDARDFKTMRDFMPLLAVLDISKCNIVTYTGTEGTYFLANNRYDANEIPDNAFYNGIAQLAKTSLQTIILPETITNIGLNAFYKCTGLNSITIPTTVTKIDSKAFSECSFSEPINLSASVTNIYSTAFSGFKGVLIVDSNNPNYSTIDSVLFDKKITTLIHCSRLKTGNYIVPSSVKTIGTDAFQMCSQLSTITLQDSVTTIEDNAFANCTNLTSVNLPNSIRKLEYGTFNNCSKLTSMVIPEGVRKLHGTFSGCSQLSKLTLPNTLNIIGSTTLFGCGLERLQLPLSVDSIGDVHFTTSFDTLTVLWHTPLDLFNRTALDQINRSYCILRVPYGLKSTYQNSNVWNEFTKIEEMNGIFIPKNNINIGVEGGTKDFTITSSSNWNVTSNEEWLTLSVNSGKTGIDTVSISASPNATANFRIAILTFRAEGLDSKTITIIQNPIIISAAGNLSTILKGKLSDITSLTLSGIIDARDFKTMRDSMPYLREVDLENTTISAYTGTYGTLSYTSSYPANEVPGDAFYKSKIEKVVLPNTTSSIGEYCFFNCFGLNSLNIPEGVTRIESYSFYGCTKLPAITIPATVTSIDSVVFSGGNALINVDELNPNYCSIDGVLFNKSQTNLIHCPASKTGQYSIPLTATYIGSYGFFCCKKLTSIVLSPQLKSIGYKSFYQCDSIQTISIPSSVTTIGKCAFEECTGLISIIIPSTVQTIGSHLFYHCDKLQSVIINSPIQELPEYTFYYCKSLKSVTINSPLIRIQNRAFLYCTALSSFNFPQSVEYIENEAFSNCFSLKKVKIPSSTKSIGKSAFNACSSLTYASINSKTTYLGDYSFQNCTKLDSLYAFPTAPIVLSTASYVFNNVNKTTCKLFVPHGSKTRYADANQWKDFINIIEISGIFLSEDSLNFGFQAGKATLSIYSDGPWTATSNQSWLTLDPASGSIGEDTITFTIKANKGGSRTATVTFSAPGFTSQEVTINQEGVNSTLLNEGFENGGTIPANWTQEQVSSSGINWEFITGNGSTHPSAAHAGTYNACLKDNSSADNKTRLISPVINLNVIESPVLTFWHTQQAWSSDQDKLTVHYKTSLSGTWTQLATYTASLTSWTKETISLPNGSSDYYICFEGNAKYGYGVCVDDVSISGTPIMPGISSNLEITDTRIEAGISDCFNAYDSITVAGGVDSVLFRNGSTVDLIAGKSIRFLPGFHAYEGSLVNASITTDSTFCDGASESSIVEQPLEKSVKEENQSEEEGFVPVEKSIKIYPNPNNGKFSVVLTNFENGAEIRIFNAIGATIYRSMIKEQDQQIISLSGIHKGLYFVKVMDGKEQVVKKMMIE